MTVIFPILGIVSILILIGLFGVVVWIARLNRRILVVTLLSCSILLPAIPVPGLWVVRLEELLIFLLIPAIFPQMSWYWTRLDLFFAFIGVSTAISLAWGTWRGIPFNPRDLMEFVKIIKYWLFFHIALYTWEPRDINIAVNWILACMGLAAFIAILQWQNWLGIGRMLQMMYGRGASHAEAGRIVGTMANPNDFALLLVTGLAIVMGFLKDAPRVRQVYLIALGLLLIISVAITRSRTGAVGVVIVLLIGVLLRISRVRSVRKRLTWFGIAVSIMLVIGIVIVPWVSREVQRINTITSHRLLDYVEQSPLNYLVYRFSVIQSEKHGIVARIAIWQSHLELFQQSPIFGWGPGKSRHDTIVDSEYVFYLRRYGMVGLATLLLLYAQILRFSWKLLGRHQEDWEVGASILTTLLVYLAANFVIYTFYQLQLMSLFWLLVGLGYSMVRFPNTKGFSSV